LLRDKRRKRDVLSTLNQLPKGSAALDDAYDKAIKQIDEQLPGDCLLAKRALSWITYAQRPLTTKELCHAVSIEQDDKALDSDDIYDVEGVISVCAGLVAIDEESNIIRLVHYTTQEYFERVRLEWTPGAQKEIAIACLTYLSFDTFRSGSCASDKAFEQRLAENAFLDYSARHWSEHIRLVESTTSHLSLAFLCDEVLVDCTIQAASAPDYKYLGYSGHFPNRTSGLHVTARYGLLYLTERLLMSKHGDSNTGADSKDSYGQTPLSWAAENGHEAVVKLLLAKDGVDPDSKSSSGRTPLSWAAKNGHEAVVKLLLAKDGVDPDSKDSFGQTPLSWAAQDGHEAVVKLLLAKDGVGPDSKDGYGQTPLSWAAQDGHWAVVKLLLAKDGVDPDSKDDYGRTPLSWAACYGHEAVVKLLLAKDGVDPDSKDTESGRTPLSWAGGNGHEAVVKLLLAKDGVDPDSKDTESGRAPLLWAARYGHEAVVKLLLKNKANTNAEDNYGYTAIQLAAFEEFKEVEQLLVENGASGAKDIYGLQGLFVENDIY
jgi:ankyrin repeat protein